MSSQTFSPKIAIVGAGPASLTLANILQNNDISFSIYEASDVFRHQGGSLDLHPKSGQLALKEAGLWDDFVKRSRPECDAMKLVDADGQVLWDENTTDAQEVADADKFDGRPEIDRAALLEILHGNLAPSSIHFNKKLQSATPATSNEHKYDLHFADGTTETDFDLVIGGDGAWSKVRPLLSDTKPHYSGISGLELWAHDVEAKNPWLHEYIGRGSMFCFAEGLNVLAQRQDGGAARVYALLRVPEDFLSTCGIDFADHETARRQFVERYFSHISPDLQRVVLESTDNLVPRPLFELPTDFRWAHRAGVTLVGDAAHVMTPFAGVGVNVGMTDSLVLARELVDAARGNKSLDDAVAAYELELFPRAEKYALKTMSGKTRHFKHGGSKEMADMIRQAHAEHASRTD